MLADEFKKNEALLRNIYQKGPFERHALCVSPLPTPLFEHPEGDFTLSDKPVDQWIEKVEHDYRRWVNLQQQLEDDGVPVARLATGTHIFAAAFGCSVKTLPDSIPFAMPLVDSAGEADQLAEPDVFKSPTLVRCFELARLITERLGPDVPISVPDIQSGFDTASLIWNKEDFLCALVTDPDAVKRLCEKCARLLKTFLTEFRKEFPHASPCHCPLVWAPPEMGPWLSNDECGAFSSQTFEEFCMPELIDLSDTFGGLGMHCCADAEHQFESFKKIPNFYAFNRVAGQRGYKTILDHFNDKDAPVFVLAWIEPEDIDMLIRNAGPDMRFIFNFIAEDIDQAKAWHDQIQNIKGFFKNC